MLSILDNIKRLLDEADPDERAEILQELSKTYYDAKEDIILSQFVEDLESCEDPHPSHCASCEDKWDCFIEMRNVVSYLLVTVSSLYSELAKYHKKLDILGRKMLSTSDDDDDDNDEYESYEVGDDAYFS